ncbi:hypothetical protein PINS_up006547 [Pythium insidiosum]|nr:hypothetical protein PINS_up006547 [Pythium insidiosum]
MSSQELDSLLAKPEEQTTLITCLDDWLRLFNGRVIENKADGRCLYQAVDGALRASLKVKFLGDGKFSVKEAHTLKQIACTYLIHYLPQMIDDGTVLLAELHERYFGVRDDNISDHVKYIEVVAHVWETSNFPAGAALPPDHWSGAEEIFGLVWYLREPLFVIGADAHVQVYIVEQAEAKSPYDERMVILTPTDNEAWAMLQTILNHGAVPRVLIHASGHFRTFRFPEPKYSASQASQRPADDRDTARDRLNIALVKLDLYAAFARTPLVLATPDDVVLTPSQLSGSLYTPSSGDIETSQELIHSMSPEGTMQLLGYLNPHQRLRSTERNLWRAAEQANLTAMQAREAPGHTTDDNPRQVEAIAGALERRQTNAELVVDFLSYLPQPLVALVRAPEAIITRIGKEIAMEGRAAFFRKKQAEMPAEAATRLENLNVLSGLTTDEKWKQAQDKLRWQSLSELLGSDVYHRRSLPETDESRVFRMLVALVITLPKTAAFSVKCEVAHTWISTSAADARQLLIEMRCHNWTNISRVSAEIGGRIPPSAVAGEGSR